MSQSNLAVVDGTTMEEFKSADYWQEKNFINYRKTVELGRKLGKMHKNVAVAKNLVTDTCNELIVKGGFPPTSEGVMRYRNIVRALKGKNLL